MNFIEELYYGNINPNEKRYDGHTDYAKEMRKFCNNENYTRLKKQFYRQGFKTANVCNRRINILNNPCKIQNNLLSLHHKPTNIQNSRVL